MTKPFNKAALTLVFESGLADDFELHIGTPVQVGDHEWQCPFRFKGFSRVKVDWISGGTRIQSMALALRVAGAVFAVLDEVKDGSVTWQGGASLTLTWP
jgi:hypothetical protein